MPRRSVPAGMPHRATLPVGAPACYKVRALRARARGRCASRRQRPAVDAAARVPADDDLGRPHDAGLRRDAAATSSSPPAATPSTAAADAAATRPPARSAKPRRRRARAAAASRQQPRGHRARRRRAHVQHDRLGERAPLGAVVAVPRGARRAPRARPRWPRRPRPWRSTAGPSRRAAGVDSGGGVRSWSCGEQREVDVEYRMGASSHQHGRDRRGKVCTQQRNCTEPACAEALVEAPERRPARIAGEPRGAPHALRDRAPADRLRERVRERHEDRGGVAVGRRRATRSRRARSAGRSPALGDAHVDLVPRSPRVDSRSRAPRAPASPARPRARSRSVPSAPAGAAARAPSPGRRARRRAPAGRAAASARRATSPPSDSASALPVERERERAPHALVRERPARRIDAQDGERRRTGTASAGFAAAGQIVERDVRAARADRRPRARRRRPAA